MVGVISTKFLTQLESAEAFAPLVIGGIYLSKAVVAALGATTAATFAYGATQTYKAMQSNTDPIRFGLFPEGKNVQPGMQPIAEFFYTPPHEADIRNTINGAGGFQPAPLQPHSPGYQDYGNRGPWDTADQNHLGQWSGHRDTGG